MSAGCFLCPKHDKRQCKKTAAEPFFQNKIGLKYQVEDVIPLLPGVNITGNGARDIIIQQRLIDNETYTMFFNRAQTAFTGKIDNQDIYLAPSCGTLVSNNNFPQSPTNNMTLVKELDNWNITFPENQGKFHHIY